MLIEFSIDYFSDQFLKTKCTEKKKNLRNFIKFDLIHCIKKTVNIILEKKMAILQNGLYEFSIIIDSK